jgi:hypothetical protein
LRYGTAKYGSKYTVAARVTGYDPQTLMNMVYVARRYESSRRREKLSWSHHAEVARFDVEVQDYWLDRATEERLSVRDVRELLADDPAGSRRKGPPRIGGNGRALKRGSSAGRSSRSARSASSERVVVCPHCGHHFAEGGDEH